MNVDAVRHNAERIYRDGDFYCSEAVVKAIRDQYLPELPDEVIAAASGFPGGMGGAGCTCGAVSGGVMALGLVFGRSTARDKRVKKCMQLAKELHETFRRQNVSLCCRVLTKKVRYGSSEHVDQCVRLTGEVAAEVARIIEREQGERWSLC